MLELYEDEASNLLPSGLEMNYTSDGAARELR